MDLAARIILNRRMDNLVARGLITDTPIPRRLHQPDW
jgi:hypothetical protein